MSKKTDPSKTDPTKTEISYILPKIIISEEKNENSHPLATCCMFLALLIIIVLAISLIGLAVCYYYFGIHYLSDYKEINDKCNSNIWSHVLVSLIISAISVCVMTSNEDSDDMINSWQLFIMFIWFGIGTWGYTESYYAECTAIRNTKLWTFSYVLSIVQLSIASTILIVKVIKCIFYNKSRISKVNSIV